MKYKKAVVQILCYVLLKLNGFKLPLFLQLRLKLIFVFDLFSAEICFMQKVGLFKCSHPYFWKFQLKMSGLFETISLNDKYLDIRNVRQNVFKKLNLMLQIPCLVFFLVMSYEEQKLLIQNERVVRFLSKVSY